MGILEKIFGGGPSAGTHPDSAIRTTERGEAQRYVNGQYTCPSCGKKGSKEIRGHAQVLRKLTNGQAKFYDVYNVFCGCGEFSTFWADSSAWVSAMMQLARHDVPTEWQMQVDHGKRAGAVHRSLRARCGGESLIEAVKLTSACVVTGPGPDGHEKSEEGDREQVSVS